jgi:trk system potassium uptake protein TrkA
MAPRKQFAVIGLGRFGRAVCRTLTGLGHEVLGIDEDPVYIRMAQDDDVVTHVIQADATNVHAVREAGLRNMDAVVVAIGEDLEASVLIILNLLELGLTSIIAKASHRRYGDVLERVGGGHVRVVYPEEQMGERVAHGLGGLGVMESIDLDPHTSIVEIAAPRALIGRTLAEAQARQRYGVTVIAILRGGVVNAAPCGPDRVEAGDILALVGSNERLTALQQA